MVHFPFSKTLHRWVVFQGCKISPIVPYLPKVPHICLDSKNEDKKRQLQICLTRLHTYTNLELETIIMTTVIIDIFDVTYRATWRMAFSKWSVPEVAPKEISILQSSIDLSMPFKKKPNIFQSTLLPFVFMGICSIYNSGQIIIFHQPRFLWNKGISFTKPPFGVRSCEVPIIWPDNSNNLN